jgi:hypothetical protein
VRGLEIIAAQRLGLPAGDRDADRAPLALEILDLDSRPLGDLEGRVLRLADEGPLNREEREP